MSDAAESVGAPTYDLIFVSEQVVFGDRLAPVLAAFRSRGGRVEYHHAS